MASGYRTVSFDGCKPVKVPDTPAKRGWLGKMNAALGVAGYPVIQFMVLAETGAAPCSGPRSAAPPPAGWTGAACCCTCWTRRCWS
jgi:hypothetical protein